jgi:hypothetical protein
MEDELLVRKGVALEEEREEDLNGERDEREGEDEGETSATDLPRVRFNEVVIELLLSNSAEEESISLLSLEDISASESKKSTFFFFDLSSALGSSLFVSEYRFCL